ncbi:MAG: GAF domain-containing protein [Gemmatimonadetes bacterium]|nr:GAF domain-containing protein [Gemmatimonadota bacterium]
MVNTTDFVKHLQGLRDEGYLSDALLRETVKKLASSDERFDWVGVYVHDEQKQELWLHNYVGEPTEHARIAVGQGVCGTAVAEHTNRNVPDVRAEANYLACSPDVRSELVVLIRAGDTIFGQIDIDSHKPAAFTDADEQGIQLIADKLAEQLAWEKRR